MMHNQNVHQLVKSPKSLVFPSVGIVHIQFYYVPIGDTKPNPNIPRVPVPLFDPVPPPRY